MLEMFRKLKDSKKLLLSALRMLTFKNVYAYVQGNLRYKIYYSKFSFLLPFHIKNQIDWRISIMDKECFRNGSCKLCGCQTTHLQMADKACDKPCYPPMMNKEEWKLFKEDLKKS